MSTLKSGSATATLADITPTSENTISIPTQTPSDNLPTDTLIAALPTATSTIGAYPGPDPTDDPYPGPQPTNDPYPGPGGTSTPFPIATITPTSTGDPAQPTPTLPPTQTPQLTTPTITPTQVETEGLPSPTAPPTTTLSFSEISILTNGAVNQAIWSLDALTLTLATSDGIYLIDAETLQRVGIIDKGSTTLSVIAAFNGDLIAAGGGDADIRWWNPETRKYFGSLQGHLLGVVGLGLPNFNGSLASGSDDASVRIWDISNIYTLGTDGVRLNFTFYEPQNRVTDLAVSGNGEIVAASSNQHVHIWNPFSGELIKTIRQPLGWYTALALSPDSQILMTAYDGRRLEFWDTNSWVRAKFLPLGGPVRTLSYSTDGSLFAMGYEDGRIQIWNALNLQQLADLPGHENLTHLVFNPSGNQLATSSENGTIRLWDLSPLRNP